jgi:hypothetical protein
MENEFLPDWCRDVSIVCDNAKSPSNSLSSAAVNYLPALVRMRMSMLPRKKQNRLSSSGSHRSPRNQSSTIERNFTREINMSRPPAPRQLKKTVSDSGPRMESLVSIVTRRSSTREIQRVTKSSDNFGCLSPQKPVRKVSLSGDDRLSSDIVDFKLLDLSDSDDENAEVHVLSPTLPQLKSSQILAGHGEMDDLFLEKECLEFGNFKNLLSSIQNGEINEFRLSSDCSVDSEEDEDDDIFPSSKLTQIESIMCARPPQIPQRKISLSGSQEELAQLEFFRNLATDSADGDDSDEDSSSPTIRHLPMSRYATV